MAQNNNNNENFDIRAFIANQRDGTISKYSPREIVYRQGDRANAVFYIVAGTVKVTFNTEHGKEAVVAILVAGDFFGEGCISGETERRTTIVATSACEIARLDLPAANRVLENDAAFSQLFMKFLLRRVAILKADLINQLVNSSEKRLAQLLLTLAKFGQAEQSSTIRVPINQELLANMVGTTRSRINEFMNKFRKMGHIEYSGHESDGQIKVHNTLFDLLLED